MILAIRAPANERAGNRQAEILGHRVSSLLYSAKAYGDVFILHELCHQLGFSNISTFFTRGGY